VPSRSNRIDVVCPECQARNPFEQWEVVDAVESPDLVARILEGTLFDFTCRNCEELITLDYSFRLEDHANRRMLQYDPLRGIPLEAPAIPLSNYRLLRVSDPNAITEVARIWKDSLNDGVMLVIKHLLAGDLERSLGFRPDVCGYTGRADVEGEAHLAFVVQFNDEEPRDYSVQWSLYEKLRAGQVDGAGADITGQGWIPWNSETAGRLLRALNDVFSAH